MSFLIDVDLYSASLHAIIACSVRLADVMAVSSGCLTHKWDQWPATTKRMDYCFNHIEIRACWVFWCLCNPPNSDMDYRIFIVRAWSSACVHTLDLGFESHPKDYYYYSQQQNYGIFFQRWLFLINRIIEISNETWYERATTGLHNSAFRNWVTHLSFELWVVKVSTPKIDQPKSIFTIKRCLRVLIYRL